MLASTLLKSCMRQIASRAFTRNVSLAANARPLSAPSQITLYSSPLGINSSYILPTAIPVEQKRTILDPSLKKTIELPPLFQNGSIIEKFSPAVFKNEISDPAPRGRRIIKKEAKNVLKFRRRRMNRKKLKKLRKRMKFVYLAVARNRHKRKMQRYADECQKWIKQGEEFDPIKVVEQRLEEARKGGFKIDVFESRRKGVALDRD